MLFNYQTEVCTGNKLPEVLTVFFVSEFNLQSPYCVLVQNSHWPIKQYDMEGLRAESVIRMKS